MAAAALVVSAPVWGEDLPQSVTKNREMVVTANPLATAAGEKILKLGGSAADAMVAVQAVLGLVEPQSSGLGGGAFVVYYDAQTGTTTTIDAREKAPAAATEDRFADLGTALPARGRVEVAAGAATCRISARSISRRPARTATPGCTAAALVAADDLVGLAGRRVAQRSSLDLLLARQVVARRPRSALTTPIVAVGVLVAGLSVFTRQD